MSIVRSEFTGTSANWQRKRLGELLKVRHGKSQHAVVASNGAYPILATGGEIGRTNTPLYDRPSVLIGRKGTIDAPQFIETPFWTIDTLFFTEIGPDAWPNFMFYKFQTINWRSYNEASGVPSLSASTIERIEVSIPGLVEQQIVAKALGDVDALLVSLEKLIAKKRDLKQAVMQQLLTGKTRLPGYVGQWQQCRLGDHVAFLRNGTNSRADLDATGAVRYLHYGDIHTNKNVILDVSSVEMPRLKPVKALTLDRLQHGDLVFVDASEDLQGVGKAVELLIPRGTQVVAGLHTIACRFDKSVLADGFKAYLQFVPSFRAQLTRLAAGTKVYATSHRHIADATIALPSVSEQAAIAGFISDMATEILAIEAQIEKTRLLKQGMMQELLTGKTRLIPKTETK